MTTECRRFWIKTRPSAPNEFLPLAHVRTLATQNDLNFAKKIYDLKRENAANPDDEVKKAQKALSDSGASSTNDSLSISIYIERRWLTWKRRSTTLAQNGPGLRRAKRDMKKVHHAEKELDKAKAAWKPFEKYEEKESRFESVNHCIFSY